MHVSLFHGVQNAKPAAQLDLAWNSFRSLIKDTCQHITAPSKEELTAIGPFRLKEGDTRSSHTVVSMASVVALDLEAVNVEELRRRIAGFDLEAIMYGSSGDDPNGVRKMHLFVRASTEYSPALAGGMRDKVARLLGVKYDPALPDRIFLCGSIEGKGPRALYTVKGGSSVTLEGTVRRDPSMLEQQVWTRFAAAALTVPSASIDNVVAAADQMMGEWCNRFQHVGSRPGMEDAVGDVADALGGLEEGLVEVIDRLGERLSR